MSQDEQVREDRGGMPGDGAGRREDPGRSGVYPMSGPTPDEDAPVRNQESWGQGAAGEAGYDDAGTSEIIPNDRLAGGTSSGSSGTDAGDVVDRHDEARREAAGERGRTPGTGAVTEEPEGSDALGE